MTEIIFKNKNKVPNSTCFCLDSYSPYIFFPKSNIYVQDSSLLMLRADKPEAIYWSEGLWSSRISRGQNIIIIKQL